MDNTGSTQNGGDAPSTGTSTITIDPYNASTGAGTLSYYADKYGTSVDALAKLNGISDPNKIQSGADLKVPTPMMQTTTGLENKITSQGGKLDQTLANAKNNQGGGNIGGSMIVKNTDGSYTVTNDQGKVTQIPAGGGADGSTNDAGTGPGDATNGNIDVNSEYQKMSASIDAQYQQTSDMLTQAKINADAASSALIDSIKAKYEARYTAMQDTNARLMGSTTVAGERSGRARYASTLQNGLLQDEEIKGSQRLSDITTEESNMIAQATKARDSEDMALFTKSMDALDKVNTQKLDALTKLNTIASQQEKAALDATNATSKANTDAASTAKDIASGVQDALDALPPEQQSAYFQKVVDSLKIPPLMLQTALDNADALRTKSGLSNSNIQSEIDKRNQPKAGPKPTTDQKLAQFDSVFTAPGSQGSDNFVAPEDYIKARDAWLKLYPSQQAVFDKSFKKYVNPESYDQVGLTKAKSGGGTTKARTS